MKSSQNIIKTCKIWQLFYLAEFECIQVIATRVYEFITHHWISSHDAPTSDELKIWPECSWRLCSMPSILPPGHPFTRAVTISEPLEQKLMAFKRIIWTQVLIWESQTITWRSKQHKNCMVSINQTAQHRKCLSAQLNSNTNPDFVITKHANIA